MEPNLANISRFHCIFNNIIPPFYAISWRPCHKHSNYIAVAGVVVVVVVVAVVAIFRRLHKIFTPPIIIIASRRQLLPFSEYIMQQ